MKLLSETLLIIRKTERDIIINVYWYLFEEPLFLSYFNEIRIFWTDFRKIPKYKIS